MIVVIGILAAITIVAYSGITSKASNDQTLNVVKAYENALSLYKVDNGAYPSMGDGCLGSGYVSNHCWIGPNGTYDVNPGLDSVLAPYLPSKPTPSLKSFPVTSTDNRVGVTLDQNTPGVSKIVYYLDGSNQNCYGIFGANEGGGSQCQLILQ